MTVIASILVIIGLIIALIFGIQLLIIAFRESILWGLGYLFVPFVNLIFIIMHWNETKTPFLRALIAIPFLVGGALLMPQSPPVQ